MSNFVNLDKIFLPVTGGNLEGNLGINGFLTVNDQTGKGTTYDIVSEITRLKNKVSSLESDIGGDISTPDVEPEEEEIITDNYDFYKWPAGNILLNSSTAIISRSLTVTSYGRPIFLSCSGDTNPTGESAWFTIKFYRDNELLASQICESHANSWNVPFNLTYLDIVSSGTYTYTVELVCGNGETNLNESGDKQSPQFMAFEI